MSYLSELPPNIRTENGETYFQINIKGKIYHVNFGNQWEGLSTFKKGGLTKKQKRSFMRLNSGLTNGVARKERLVFMTLTTKYDLTNQKNRLFYLKGINYGWTKLKQSIEKYLKSKMYERQCKKVGCEPYFEIRGNKKCILNRAIYQRIKFKMRYFKVKTSEGGGVLHIIFRKDYHVPKIPYSWLSKQWSKIWHDSWNVSIRQIKYTDAVKTAFYVIRGYIQNQPVVRMSYGHQWVYQGFRMGFVHLIEVYGYKRALEIWKNNMTHNILPTKAGTYQRRFKQRKIFGGYRYPKKCFDRDGYWIKLEKGRICLSKPIKTYVTEQSYFHLPQTEWEPKLSLIYDLEKGSCIIPVNSV